MKMAFQQLSLLQTEIREKGGIACSLVFFFLGARKAV